MFNEDLKTGSVPDQWGLINRVLLIYKGAAIGLTAATLVLGGLAVYFATANPVVVTEECGEKVFHEGRRQILQITDDDVKRFIEEWLVYRYTWREYDAQKIFRSLAPLTTEGLQEKLKEGLARKSARGAQAKSGQAPDSKDQKIEESITNTQVTLSDHEALAVFERIVRINGIPVVVPSEVSLQIIRGSPTRWNPLGLYVNGIIEHEER